MKITFFSVLVACSLDSLYSQSVLRGGIKAGFGVDGDVQADTAKNGPAASSSGGGRKSDDWFDWSYGSNDSGVGIIDTTGAHKIKVAKTANPGNVNYFRRLKYPQHSIIKGNMMIDAVYGSDRSGSTDSVFGPNSTVMGGPQTWTMVKSSATGKSDIIDFGSHIRRNGNTYQDSLWMFLSMSFASTKGTKEGTMELFVNDLKYNHSTKTFSGVFTNEGRLAWRFNSTGEVLVAGDMAISFSFDPSKGVFTIDPYIWMADSNRNNFFGNTAYHSPANFNYTTGTGSWEPNTSGRYGFQRIQPLSGNSFAYGSASTEGDSKSPPFGTITSNGGVTNYFQSNQMVELGMNLTALGVDPSDFNAINQNPCGVSFRTIVYRTTASGTFNGSLKDIAGPYPFWRSVFTPSTRHDTFDCLHTSATFDLPDTANVIFYNWSALPGTAQIGSVNIDGSMTTSKPGKYLLEFATETCVTFVDTITILQDTAHPIAKVTILDTLIENSVTSVVIYGGDTAATYAKLNLTAATFGPSQGLTYEWVGTRGDALGFSSAAKFPAVSDSGVYQLTLTEKRNGCASVAIGTLVMLPVEFGRFNCSKSPDGIQLSWETLMEKNLGAFECQKWNGLQYETIGYVASHGYSEIPQNYIFMDKRPQVGPNIYRIAAVSADGGNRYYTEPCLTNLSGKNENLPFLFSVHPNLGEGAFTVYSALHASSSAVVFLSDMSGRVIKNERVNFSESGLAPLDLTGFSSGMYLLGIADGEYPQTTRITIK